MSECVSVNLRRKQE